MLHAILLGAVEGITEFLPVSSTGHLTIVEKLLGYPISDPGVTAFTAIIQSGAIIAAVLFLRKDLWRMVTAWLRGLVSAKDRDFEYRFGWAVILGSVPIIVVGLVFKDFIETSLRSLWLVSGALILFSGVMWFADHAATQVRHEEDTTWKDTLLIGLAQCLALVPGVSRSGATMSAGLLRDLDRVAVTRMSFFLSIPALLGATALEVLDQSGNIATGVGWPATIVATLVSFVVGYASVAWLLRYVAHHTYALFIAYRLVAGLLLAGLLVTHTVAAT